MLKQKTKIKQFLSLFMVIIMALSFISLDIFAVSAKAASKWDGWIKISSADELQLMYGSDKNFYLTKDIDLKSVKDWEPIGENSNSASYFKGTFDGNGYVIKNLKSTKGGLFVGLEAAVIKNLGLLNVNINIQERFTGTGALASFTNQNNSNKKGCYIDNCYVTGKIESVKSSVGGLIGFSKNIEFNNCINFADIKGNEAAGICYFNNSNHNIVFNNCINLGDITGLSGNASGITDSISTQKSVEKAELISCFNAGIIKTMAKNNKGGDLISDGNLDLVKSIIKDCGYIGDYAVAKTPGQSYKEIYTFGSKKMTKSELKKQETYIGWNFDKTWYMDSKINNGYPILQIMLKNYNASKPVSDTKSGEYEKGIKLNLSAELEGVTIYYTTNGKAPTTSSTKYTGAITISKDTTIKAAVFTNKGKIRGKVETFTYKVKDTDKKKN